MNHALTGGRSLRAVGVVAGVLGAGVLMAGCKEVEPTVAEAHEPATVEEVDGLDVALVRFDRPGAERVDLSTERVRRTGDATVVPYAAVIYDPQGVAWVYTRSAPLTFQRVEVVVARVVGDRARLTDGPPGTRVVTTGATEVYGAELGIAGGH